MTDNSISNKLHICGNIYDIQIIYRIGVHLGLVSPNEIFKWVGGGYILSDI